MANVGKFSVSVVILSTFELVTLFRCNVILFDVMELLSILFREEVRVLGLNLEEIDQVNVILG